MSIFSTSWIIAFLCAFAFFGAGKQNAGLPGGKNRSFLWMGLSIAVSAVVIQLLSAGWIGVLLAQFGLFAAIGIIGSLRDR
jgi:hypothetical protein